MWDCENMIIVHEINEFLFDLFPRAKDFGNSIDILKEEITEYYTFSIYQPQVEIKDNFVFITFDVDKVSHEEKEYQKAISFCDKGKFTLAKPILEKLVKNNPTVSEYHRILGQIYSLEGDQETAINFLIDALKWNPKNGNAFILTGNIFGRFKKDVKTAIKYYNKALEINMDDYIAINNIGGNLLNLNQFEEAEKYFNLACELNPKYPNPYAGLAQVYFFKAEFLTAINFGIQAIKNSTSNDPIYKHITKLVFDSSVDYIKMNPGMKIFDRYNEELVKKCGKPIELVFDEMIEGYAKIEVAEYYSRETHFLKYKKERKGLEHLFMHELAHLNFIIEAREADNNHIFYSTTKNKELFIGDIESIFKKYEAIGLSKDEIENLTNKIFNGLNNQFFNTPIDLYIEDYLFHNFPELRPIQYLSLLEMYTENIEYILTVL